MKAIAIIPARGGSKGLPRKNVLSLAGKPLLGWTIEAAKKAEMIGETFVSTDDREIAEVAEQFGAKVIWRPAEISGDIASSESAVTHALQCLSQETVALPDLTVFLQCTSPLTLGEDIDGTVKVLIEQEADTSVAVADFHYFIWKVDRDNCDFVGINHNKKVRLMRQQREQQFIETGAIYVMKTNGFLTHQHRFFGATAKYVMPEHRVLEIDSEVDFQIAEVLLARQARQQRIASLPSIVEAVIFDFDGVFTDDRVVLSENGIESVVCSRADGMGVKLARQAGIQMLILSTEVNPVVRHRAEKLQVEVAHGVENKAAFLEKWIRARGIAWSNVVYVGNDVNDLECLALAGCGVVVANAHPEAARRACFALSRRGGDNAVRELTDLLLESRRLNSTL